jgi:hypothetical protein
MLRKLGPVEGRAIHAYVGARILLHRSLGALPSCYCVHSIFDAFYCVCYWYPPVSYAGLLPVFGYLVPLSLALYKAVVAMWWTQGKVAIVVQSTIPGQTSQHVKFTSPPKSLTGLSPLSMHLRVSIRRSLSSRASVALKRPTLAKFRFQEKMEDVRCSVQEKRREVRQPTDAVR